MILQSAGPMTKRLSIKVDEAEAEIKELRAQLDEMVLRMNDKNSGDDRRRLWQDRAEKTRAKLISKRILLFFFLFFGFSSWYRERAEDAAQGEPKGRVDRAVCAHHRVCRLAGV